MSIYRFDYETTSACDISLGGFRYAADPSTRILMFSIAKDDEDPVLWDFLDPHGEESMQAWGRLFEAVESDALISSFNVMFELAISYYRLETDVGISCPSVEQLRCTRAKALRAAIPASLAKSSEFLNLGVDKDARGKALIGVFSDQTKIVTLRKGKETMKSSSPILEAEIPWDWSLTLAGEQVTVRQAWEMFKSYCRRDVTVEREVDKALAKYELKGSELDGFLFDLRMNLRGIPVNVPALHNAQKLLDIEERHLTEEFQRLTSLMPTQTAKVLGWLRRHGYPANDLQAATMREHLGSTFMTPEGARALEIRSNLSFAAVKKIPSMIATACPDGRMRGLFTWHGAQRTGRWTASGPQPQNARKPTIKNPDEAYLDICTGVDIDTFEILYGNPYEAIASCVRNFIKPHKGRMIDTDLANIESRVAALLAGQENMLQAYRDGRDLYKELASVIFKVGLDSVTKDQRFVAKTASLACIAEGELVLTDKGLVPIEKISRCHRVWDGVEWVPHEGVVFQGYKEVLSYQGLRATADHQVFCRDREGQERKIPFWEAIQRKDRIIDTGDGEHEIRTLDYSFDRNSKERETRRHKQRICKSGMRMRESEVGLLSKSSEWLKHSVQKLFRKSAIPFLVKSKSHSSKTKMHKSIRSWMASLWGSWDRVSFCECGCRVCVDHGEFRTGREQILRSNQQPWALRGRKFTLGDSIGTGFQQKNDGIQSEFRAKRMALRYRSCKEEAEERNDPRGDNRRSSFSGKDEEEKLERNPSKTRVYDILNAGPRRRFTVSGVLVSNCVFATGAKTFHETCAAWGMPIEKKLACHTVKVWREENPEFVKTWKHFERIAIKALEEPEKWHAANQFVSFAYTRGKPFPRLLMKLPGGRNITYPLPKVSRTVKTHRDYETGETREWESDEITFYGALRGYSGWGRVRTSGPDMFQSATQGTARDILQHGCVTAEKNNFDIWAVIHDQALSDEGDVDLFKSCICTHPDWLPKDFPLSSEGFLCDYYAK